MKKFVLRRFIIALLVGGLAIGLSGCTSSTKTATPTTTLYWWRSYEDANEDTLKSVITGFEQDHKSYKIELVLKDPRTYEQEATEALAASRTVANAPDILSIRGEDLPRIAPSLAPAPDSLFDDQLTAKKKTGKTTTQYVEDLFEDVVQESVMINDSSGKKLVYGLPMGVDNLAVYKNTALFNQAIDRLSTANKTEKSLSSEQIKQIKAMLQGPIDTWEKLVAVLPYLKVMDANGNISQAAIAMGTSRNVERSYDVLQTIMMQNGTTLVSSDQNSAAFNLDKVGANGQTVTPGEQAIKFYERFSNPSDALYTWNEKMPNSYDAFIAGQTAMMFHYASTYRLLKDEAPQIKNSIDVIPMFQLADPKSATSSGKLKTMARMWIETVPSARHDSKRERASWEFVQYITSKNGAKPYLSAMKIPSALKDVATSVKFATFNDQKTYADTWYKGHKALQIDELFIGMIDDVYKARKSAKDSLDATAAQVTAVLQASKTKLASGGTSGS